MNAPARSSDRIRELERQLHWAQLKIQALEEELRQRRIQLLGPRSETLSNLQLQLLADEEPGATRDEVEAEARREVLTGTSPRERNPASGPQAAAGKSAACHRCDCLQGNHVRLLRGADGGDRLRRERTTRHGAGALFRAGDQARETSVPALLDGDRRPACRTHRRKGTGERRGGNQHVWLESIAITCRCTGKQ